MAEIRTAHEAWVEARGDSKRYRELLHKYGLILRPGDEGYEGAARGLSCRNDDKVETGDQHRGAEVR